ncbi:hypothetical protein [Bremerella sp.]|uniref:hypothetical protein n=1 Tax=Bremerella sp. TaxID=2795602 RepID=UPI0039197F72
MSSSHAQPDPRGSFSTENAPQVVVRAGKTFVCSACGTLVEIPAEVVGQLVLAANPSPQQLPGIPPGSPPDDKPAPKEASQTTASTSPDRSAVASDRPARSRSYDAPQAQQTLRAPRPRRPKQPFRESFVGQTIDGLTVPSAGELDRALKWVSFHLRVLDRQGSEIKRLKKLLKQRPTIPVPRPSPLGRASDADSREPVSPMDGAPMGHAQADVSMAPTDNDAARGSAKERGPP